MFDKPVTEPDGEREGGDHPALPGAGTVMRWAQNYLARRATSSVHLGEILERRVRRSLPRGERLDPEDESALRRLVEATVAKVQDWGLLDDAAFAASRVRVLKNKGLPGWRIGRDLDGHGLADALPPAGTEEAVDDVVQARRYAQRKRLGPYRFPGRPADPVKDLRIILRAGFSRRAAETALSEES